MRFCHRYDSAIVDEKAKLQNEYFAHQSRKQSARDAKEKYKKESQEDETKSLVVTCSNF